jgi:hypothetical protein
MSALAQRGSPATAPRSIACSASCAGSIGGRASPSVTGPGVSIPLSLSLSLSADPFRRGRPSVRGRRVGRHLMGLERIGRPIWSTRDRRHWTGCGLT